MWENTIRYKSAYKVKEGVDGDGKAGSQNDYRNFYKALNLDLLKDGFKKSTEHILTVMTMQLNCKQKRTHLLNISLGMFTSRVYYERHYIFW